MSVTFETCRSILRVFESLPTEEIQHMRRVGLLVGLFTERLTEMGYFNGGPEAYQLFGRAALYHDIGKAWVPNDILVKPGKLSEQERAIMFRHPEYSIEFFDKAAYLSITGISDCFFSLARSCALYHHEWWNGYGYPSKKAYEDIPVIARIAAICDAYDAMTSNRAYRVAHSHEFACRELMRCAGTQFQPGLVLQFLSSHISLADVTHLQTVGL